jgi:hypothetical protein
VELVEKQTGQQIMAPDEVQKLIQPAVTAPQPAASK